VKAIGISLLVVYARRMKRTNIYLAEPGLNKLRALAKKEGISVSELIRRAIDKYLEGKS
jgi:predicted DNA binding CopG/RHH family protein